MSKEYVPSLQVDSHPYTIVKHELDKLEAVGWMWEEFGLQNEWCSEDDWYTVLSDVKPSFSLSQKHLFRNIRIVYAEKVVTK